MPCSYGTLGLLFQVCDGGATGLDERERLSGEDGTGRPRSRPDDVEGQEITVAVDREGMGVAEGRHAADGEAGGALDLVGASAADVRGAGDDGEAGGVDAVGPGDEADDGVAVRHEYERLDDLTDADADGAGGVLRGAGALGELTHFDLEAGGAGGLDAALGGRREDHAGYSAPPEVPSAGRNLGRLIASEMSSKTTST